jgi:hypothetical protein
MPHRGAHTRFETQPLRQTNMPLPVDHPCTGRRAGPQGEGGRDWHHGDCAISTSPLARSPGCCTLKPFRTPTFEGLKEDFAVRQRNDSLRSCYQATCRLGLSISEWMWIFLVYPSCSEGRLIGRRIPWPCVTKTSHADLKRAGRSERLPLNTFVHPRQDCVTILR